MLGCVVLVYVTLCYGMLRYVLLYYVVVCCAGYVVWCNVKLFYVMRF